jgi:hypothetical protein
VFLEGAFASWTKPSRPAAHSPHWTVALSLARTACITSSGGRPLLCHVLTAVTLLPTWTAGRGDLAAGKNCRLTGRADLRRMAAPSPYWTGRPPPHGDTVAFLDDALATLHRSVNVVGYSAITPSLLTSRQLPAPPSPSCENNGQLNMPCA